LARKSGGQALTSSHRVSEKLIIGDQVTLTVLSVHGRQVRLGISAPKTVAVHREIFERIQREGDTVTPGDPIAATPVFDETPPVV
jgi:carbon storage regulator